MTKKELKKYTVEFMNNETGSNRSNINSVMGKMLIKYAEVFQKRITELEAQIEKMKCCGNCQKLRCRFDSKTNINILYCSDSDMKQIEVGFQMCCCKWEIKEK